MTEECLTFAALPRVLHLFCFGLKQHIGMASWEGIPMITEVEGTKHWMSLLLPDSHAPPVSTTTGSYLCKDKRGLSDLFWKLSGNRKKSSEFMTTFVQVGFLLTIS